MTSQTDQQNRIGRPEVGPSTSANVVYDEGGISNHWDTRDFLISDLRTIGQPFGKKDSRHYKWAKDRNFTICRRKREGIPLSPGSEGSFFSM